MKLVVFGVHHFSFHGQSVRSKYKCWLCAPAIRPSGGRTFFFKLGNMLHTAETSKYHADGAGESGSWPGSLGLFATGPVHV